MEQKHLSLVFFFCFLVWSQNLGNVNAAKEGFIGTRGQHFVLNGIPYYANGFNAYWLMSAASDPSRRGEVSAAFQQASSHGLTVARTWAFSDGGYAALQYSPGSYNEQMFKGLDFVISEARRYGIRLILSLVNNYENFGGKKQYVQWARNQGQGLSSDDDFFSNSLTKEYYKNHIKTVLTRYNSMTGLAYRDDPTIFAWELMNEPRCTSDLSGRTIQDWISEMAAYLKSVDSKHLLEVGLEGFYGKSSPKNPHIEVGTDFISNNLISGIDFATLHSYPDQWLTTASDQAQLAFLNNWLDTHIQDTQSILKKPLLLTEFGKSKKDPGFNLNQRDALFNIVYSKIYLSAKSGGPASGGLFWQLLTQGMGSYGDGYEIIFTEIPSTANMIAQQSRKLNQLGKFYAHLRNVEKLKRAKAMRRSQAKNGGKKIGN